MLRTEISNIIHCIKDIPLQTSKHKTIILCMLALSVQPVLAAQQERPITCPNLAAIKTVGVNVAERWMGGPEWQVHNSTPNRYGTNIEWFFFMAPLNASDEKHAIAKGNEGISLLSLTSGPETDNNGFTWNCSYSGQFSNSELPLLAMVMTLPNS